MSAARNSQKVITRSVGSNAFSFVIRFAAKASFLYIGARLYGAAHYGVFTMATAMVELAVPIASLGLKRMIFPWLEEVTPEDGSDSDLPRAATHIVLDALLMAAVAGILVSAIVMLATQLLPAWMVSDQLRFAFALLVPAVLLQNTADIALAATRWTHKMRYEVIARGLVEPYVLTGAVLAAWYFGMTEHGLLLGYWVGSIALALFALWSARHCLGSYAVRAWRPNWRKMKTRAGYLAPASGSDVINSLAQRVDLYMVGLLLGDAAAGIYGVLRQLRTPIVQVRQAFDGILVPLIARTMRESGDLLTGQATAAATRVILTIQLAIALLIGVCGHSLLGLFGPQYVIGYSALVMMVLAETVNNAFGVSEIIIFYRRPSVALTINILLVLTVATLVPLLSFAFGITGAAIAMFVSAIFIALIRRHRLKQFHIFNVPFHAVVPVAAASFSAIVAYELSLTLGPESMVAQVATPMVALILYGAAIMVWLRRRPGVLSLANFRLE